MTQFQTNHAPSLAGKSALVFGGSRGIGAAIAKRLAEDGADVALTYVSAPDHAAATVRDIVALGRAGVAIQADSASADDLGRAVAQAVDRFGKLDIAVVNAGILRLGPVDTFSVEDLDLMLSVNVRGVFLAIQAAVARMGPGGRVVTIGSNTAVNNRYAGSSVYTMTKAAVAAMVKGVALDVAARGITVNNVQPGPTLTDMTRDHVEHILPAIPVKRVGSPEEIAGVVSYLARAESGYMTGASLTIDGGMTL
ncbi:3-oxoacyl-ACP reductase family protein [Bordetella genomosp. 4]|uniref:3-oxoacyl-ACP reductase family protein n=1 Tax=Bordetella genomosp. 4 TaxID=463044 RepID=UPI000B9ED147|nr:3-oxoacyl-ACP reductase family protein [Bordetella genomosp. 4]